MCKLKIKNNKNRFIQVLTCSDFFLIFFFGKKKKFGNDLDRVETSKQLEPILIVAKVLIYTF